MIFTSFREKSYIIALSLLVVFLIISAGASAHENKNTATPRINLESTLGAEQTFELTFDSKHRIKNPTFELLGEICDVAEIVDVPRSVKRGENTLSIKTVIPDDPNFLRKFKGNLKIRPAKKKNKKINLKLKLVVSDGWPVSIIPELKGISVRYPNFGIQPSTTVEQIDTDVSLLNLTTIWAGDEQSPIEQASLLFEANTSNWSLDEWLDATYDPDRTLRDSQTYQFNILQNGVTLYVRDKNFPSAVVPGGPLPQIFALTPLGDQLITGALGHENEWSNFLSPGESRTDILLDIFAQIDFD